MNRLFCNNCGKEIEKEELFKRSYLILAEGQLPQTKPGVSDMVYRKPVIEGEKSLCSPRCLFEFTAQILKIEVP